MIGIIIDLFMDLSGLRKKAEKFGGQLADEMLNENCLQEDRSESGSDERQTGKQTSSGSKNKTSKGAGKRKKKKQDQSTILIVVGLCALVILLIALPGLVKQKPGRTATQYRANQGSKAELVSANSAGEELDPESIFPDSGQTTVLYFHSDACPHCLSYPRLLTRLAAQKPDIRFLKVMIDRPGSNGIDFHSPVAEQFGINAVPKFKIYRGKDLIESDAEAKATVINWMRHYRIAY